MATSQAKNEFVLGSRSFTSKKAVDAYMRQILYAAVIGCPLAGDDFCVVFNLLLRHPESDKKIGAGVAVLTVQTEPRWNTRHFQITRIDGSTTDFSFKKCINPPSKMTEFRCACRHLIADQIISFRNRVFAAAGGTLRCPLRGTVLTPNTAHIDHAPPNTFETLVQLFLAANNIDVQTVEITGTKDNEMQKGFANTDLKLRWQAFHLERAVLRVVSPQANLSDVKMSDVKKLCQKQS